MSLFFFAFWIRPYFWRDKKREFFLNSCRFLGVWDTFFVSIEKLGSDKKWKFWWQLNRMNAENKQNHAFFCFFVVVTVKWKITELLFFANSHFQITQPQIFWKNVSGKKVSLNVRLEYERWQHNMMIDLKTSKMKRKLESVKHLNLFYKLIGSKGKFHRFLMTGKWKNTTYTP